ncbi:hypothetical protein KK060_08930 [Fulvivirgaceae bacterium PWU20]|uniref:Uncharacterized protein n=1 Tax=Chryseosolibacter indicus TaxID=2782351 RepID=A0ABS5VPX6_9BACT|nr:hypothetical protein [Chryseosolibacter indicus]
MKSDTEREGKLYQEINIDRARHAEPANLNRFAVSTARHPLDGLLHP